MSLTHQVWEEIGHRSAETASNLNGVETMTAISLALPIIRREEGLRLQPYRCTAGVWTVGYGTVIDWPAMVACLDAHGEGLLINRSCAEAMLLQRIERDHILLSHLGWYTSQTPERQAVLLSMSYQLGLGGLARFRRTHDALSAGNHDAAAREMLDSQWARQTPERAHRQAEAMRTGDISYWSK